MSDRKKVILQIMQHNSNLNQLQLSREVKKQTGHGVAFPQLKRLRQAVADGNYDATYDSIFGQPPAPAVKRKPGRPRKNSANSDAPAAEKSAKKVRGERRARYEVRGRRTADKNKIQLDSFSEHLVVYRTREGLQQETFKSRERAEALVRELLRRGHTATEIAYYRLNPLKASVTIALA